MIAMRPDPETIAAILRIRIFRLQGAVEDRGGCAADSGRLAGLERWATHPLACKEFGSILKTGLGPELTTLSG